MLLNAKWPPLSLSNFSVSIYVKAYRLLRKDRQGRQGGDVTLYASNQLERMELRLGMDEEPREGRDR